MTTPLIFFGDKVWHEDDTDVRGVRMFLDATKLPLVEEVEERHPIEL